MAPAAGAAPAGCAASRQKCPRRARRARRRSRARSRSAGRPRSAAEADPDSRRLRKRRDLEISRSPVRIRPWAFRKRKPMVPLLASDRDRSLPGYHRETGHGRRLEVVDLGKYGAAKDVLTPLGARRRENARYAREHERKRKGEV